MDQAQNQPSNDLQSTPLTHGRSFMSCWVRIYIGRSWPGVMMLAKQAPCEGRFRAGSAGHWLSAFLSSGSLSCVSLFLWQLSCMWQFFQKCISSVSSIEIFRRLPSWLLTSLHLGFKHKYSAWLTPHRAKRWDTLTQSQTCKLECKASWRWVFKSMWDIGRHLALNLWFSDLKLSLPPVSLQQLPSLYSAGTLSWGEQWPSEPLLAFWATRCIPNPRCRNTHEFTKQITLIKWKLYLKKPKH